MAPRTDADRLQAAWRALEGNGEGTGWRTIPIELRAVPCRLLAGRYFPGDQEAILVGFKNVAMPPESHLPQGGGFRVAKLDVAALGRSHGWLALTRKPGGSVDFFSMMAGDVVSLLTSCSSAEEDRLFHLFLSRIRAWQDFMERRREGVLSQEAEVGLFGELAVLKGLIETGIPARIVLDGWQGPLDGLQDFLLGTGAIEVKATLAASGFPAIIGSLEQLDDSVKQPLFLAGVRLVLSASGQTLPEFAAKIRELIRDEPLALGTFESRLVQAGFLEAMADRYVRRFAHSRTSVLPVDDGFPRLTRRNVGMGIRKARYELDLDLVGVDDVGLGRALEQLGG